MLLACPLTASAATRKVLVLNSYHQGYEWTDDVVRGIRDRFGESPELELYIEYLDVRRTGASVESLDVTRSLLATKYGGVPLAAVIVSDDAAVEFLLKYGSQLFPRVPVVFCGVNEYRGSSRYIRQHEYARSPVSSSKYSSSRPRMWP
jgi:hypothetical protein